MSGGTVAGYQDAIRQALAPVASAWSGTGFIINYPDVVEKVPSASTPWARVTFQHVQSEQRSISRPGQLYTSQGIMITQVFTPQGSGISSTQKSDLVQLILDALRGQQTSGGLFFMRVTPKEIGASGQWYQTNISCFFQYDERLS